MLVFAALAFAAPEPGAGASALLVPCLPAGTVLPPNARPWAVSDHPSEVRLVDADGRPVRARREVRPFHPYDDARPGSLVELVPARPLVPGPYRLWCGGEWRALVVAGPRDTAPPTDGDLVAVRRSDGGYIQACGPTGGWSGAACGECAHLLHTLPDEEAGARLEIETWPDEASPGTDARLDVAWITHATPDHAPGDWFPEGLTGSRPPVLTSLGRPFHAGPRGEDARWSPPGWDDVCARTRWVDLAGNATPWSEPVCTRGGIALAADTRAFAPDVRRALAEADASIAAIAPIRLVTRREDALVEELDHAVRRLEHRQVQIDADLDALDTQAPSPPSTAVLRRRAEAASARVDALLDLELPARLPAALREALCDDALDRARAIEAREARPRWAALVADAQAYGAPPWRYAIAAERARAHPVPPQPRGSCARRLTHQPPRPCSFTTSALRACARWAAGRAPRRSA